MPKDFFKVTDLDRVLEIIDDFPRVGVETVSLLDSLKRVLVRNVHTNEDLPDFKRATMDGFALHASSTFGATESNPAYVTVKGAVDMGEIPSFSVRRGEAARISTGGMLPATTDSVVMVEHTAALDDTVIEIYRSVAPGSHVIEVGEDYAKDTVALAAGCRLRPQEMGLLAAFGHQTATVYKKPVVGIISTGDEIVPIDRQPGPGHVRDINSYTLSGLVQAAGGAPVAYGIVQDNLDTLREKCRLALDSCDAVLISGGSSVGMRDFTIEVVSSFPSAEILVHGMSISPGKPTILARVKDKAIWGLPGQVTSTMVVFSAVVRPFLFRITGGTSADGQATTVAARLNRSLSSAQGRVDYVRVKLTEKGDVLEAEPQLGKSGLLNTMVKADGLLMIDLNTEGLDRGTTVDVALL